MWGLPLIVICAVMAVRSVKGADFELCTRDDKDCRIKVANIIYDQVIAGDPSSNIESIDPMFHDEVDGDLASLKYKLSNSTINGFKNCKIEDFSLSMDDTSMHSEMSCPFFNVHGTYEIDGKILALPIKGKGDYIMECKDYHVVLDSKLKMNEVDGKKYITIKSYQSSGELKGGMIDMKNLFNGQKQLADTLLKVLNENWVAVANELQGPVFNANLKKIIKNYNKYFKARAISTIFI